MHLSRRLKCTIVITCPSVIPPSLTFTFSTSSLKPLNGIQRNLTGSKISISSTMCFLGWFEKQDGRPGLWLAEKFSTSSLKPLIGILWNRWLEFNKTWQEARSQCPLPSLCFSGRSEKQNGRPGLWFAESFLTSLMKPLNRIKRNLTGRKISTSSTKFVFFRPIWKTRWPLCPLIGWDIFDFFSETTEQNAKKLDRKQNLTVLYLDCTFRADQKKQDCRPGLWLAYIFFHFSSETPKQNSTKLDRKQDIKVLYQVCVFRADRKNKMAAPASDWMRHFWLFWNRWTELNETWQEERSQRPLPSLCFSGRSEKQDGHTGVWLAETFWTSLKLLKGIKRNLTGSKISTSSTKFVFFRPMSKWGDEMLYGDIVMVSAKQSATYESLFLTLETRILAKFDIRQNIVPPWRMRQLHSRSKSPMT